MDCTHVQEAREIFNLIVRVFGLKHIDLQARGIRILLCFNINNNFNFKTLKKLLLKFGGCCGNCGHRNCCFFISMASLATQCAEIELFKYAQTYF